MKIRTLSGSLYLYNQTCPPYPSGNLRVGVINANQTTSRTYVFSKTGNQGNTWRKAVVDIGQLPPGYMVQFDAYPSKKILAGIPQSDMAIDDISFLNCAASAVDTNTCKCMTSDNAYW